MTAELERGGAARSKRVKQATCIQPCLQHFDNLLKAKIRTSLKPKTLRDPLGIGAEPFSQFKTELESRSCERVSMQVHRLCVAIGRGTFSAAFVNALDLRRDAHAILVGEPPGERPWVC